MNETAYVYIDEAANCLRDAFIEIDGDCKIISGSGFIFNKEGDRISLDVKCDTKEDERKEFRVIDEFVDAS